MDEVGRFLFVEPIAGTAALLLDTFDAADASGEDGVEQAVVTGFGDELADGAEFEVDS